MLLIMCFSSHLFRAYIEAMIYIRRVLVAYSAPEVQLVVVCKSETRYDLHTFNIPKGTLPSLTSAAPITPSS